MRHNSLLAHRVVKQRRSLIPGSFVWILITVLTVVAIPFGLPRRAHPVPAAEPPADNVVKIETRIPAQGHDKQNRVLPFTVYVLTQELSWKLQSATDLEGGHSILSPELVAAVNGSRDVFCIGTASAEGRTITEEARAAQRASQLARWVGSMVRDPEQTRVFALNAGQYQGPDEILSVSQRKAILIATGPHDQAVDLGEGLASGLAQQQHEFPMIFSLLHHYSRSATWLQIADPSRDARRKKPRLVSRLSTR